MNEANILYETLMYGVRDVYKDINPPVVTSGRWSWMFTEHRAGIQHVQLSFGEPGDINNLLTDNQYLVVHGQEVFTANLRMKIPFILSKYL